MARKSFYYIPKMCFFVTESSFTDQSAIQYYHFCSNTVNEHEIQPRTNKRKLEALTDVVGTILGPYKKQNETNYLL